MGRFFARTQPDTGLWALRPTDLPPPPAASAPHLQGLEENVIFRHLVHSHRRHRNQRIMLVAFYLGSWLLLGPLYGHFVLGAGFGVSLVRTAALLLVLTIGIANIYVFAGIEGYETNGWLKNRFFDVITSGVTADEILRGILGKTATHYPPTLVRGGLIGASLLLLGLILSVPLQSSTVLFVWLLYLGVFGAFQLLGGFSSLAYITIPGTLLWYRGVRRSYEQRLAERDGQNVSVVGSLLRMLVFLTLSVAVVLLPISAYLYAGIVLGGMLNFPWSEGQRIAILCGAYPVFALAGYLSGRFWGWLARRTAPGRLKRLEAELDRLFSIRGDLLYGG